MSTRFAPAALIAGLSAILFSSLAWAHVLLERKEGTPNSAYRGVIQVMHGCDGMPTTRISVTIPEGVIGAKPMPKPGWQVGTTTGAYARSYPSAHGTVSEGVKTITWTGGSLPDDQVDEFTFFARISGAVAPGTSVYFPIEQDCAKGGYRWIEVPADGRDAQALNAPAPAIRILANSDAVARSGATPVKAGDLTIKTPWLRATPGGAKVAGGYVSLTNTGTQPDKLIGASIPQAAKGEIHTMTTEGGVMKMAEVEGGLAVEPGKSVELKPGGLHLMFLDLSEGLKPGDTVAGTLTFARAGTVPVTFSVAPIGAKGPGGAPSADPGAGSHHDH